MVTAEELRDRIDKLTQEAEKLLLKGNFDDARSYREHVHLLRQELEDLTGGVMLQSTGVPCCLVMMLVPSLGRVVFGSRDRAGLRVILCGE